MKFGKPRNPPVEEVNGKPKTKPKVAPAKYEGSRLSSLLLLILTVLISLFFYASGQH